MFKFDFQHHFLSGWRLKLLIWLLAIDIVAIIVDACATLLKKAGLTGNPDKLAFLRLDSEFGIWAPYGYLKLFVVAGLLFAVWRATEKRCYMLIAVVFGYTAMDDAFLIHERAGRQLSQHIDLSAFGTFARVGIAESFYFIVSGSLIVALLFLAVRQARGEHRLNAMVLSVLMLALGFCAVIVNVIESVLMDISRLAAKAVSFIDDGGELVITSFALVLAASLYAEYRRAARPVARTGGHSPLQQ